MTEGVPKAMIEVLMRRPSHACGCAASKMPEITAWSSIRLSVVSGLPQAVRLMILPERLGDAVHSVGDKDNSVGVGVDRLGGSRELVGDRGFGLGHGGLASGGCETTQGLGLLTARPLRCLGFQFRPGPAAFCCLSAVGGGGIRRRDGLLPQND